MLAVYDRMRIHKVYSAHDACKKQTSTSVLLLLLLLLLRTFI